MPHSLRKTFFFDRMDIIQEREAGHTKTVDLVLTAQAAAEEAAAAKLAMEIAEGMRGVT